MVTPRTLIVPRHTFMTAGNIAATLEPTPQLLSGIACRVDNPVRRLAGSIVIPRHAKLSYSLLVEHTFGRARQKKSSTEDGCVRLTMS
jgi:hypothetical protein